MQFHVGIFHFFLNVSHISSMHTTKSAKRYIFPNYICDFKIKDLSKEYIRHRLFPSKPNISLFYHKSFKFLRFKPILFILTKLKYFSKKSKTLNRYNFPVKQKIHQTRKANRNEKLFQKSIQRYERIRKSATRS